ncbi:hypothetical protein LINGRAHAP2_LOCUS12769 [Linum grandiflorum]
MGSQSFSYLPRSKLCSGLFDQSWPFSLLWDASFFLSRSGSVPLASLRSYGHFFATACKDF